MTGISDAVTEDRNGSVILLEVTTGAHSDVFPSGYNAWRTTIACRVTAQAVNGKANKAVTALIAKVLGVPVSSVSISSGTTSAQKRIRIAGLTKAQVIECLLATGYNDETQ
ncbi:MAG: DUF167 family protein [Methanoregula sp.]|jgi:hypothetical protein